MSYMNTHISDLKENTRMTGQGQALDPPEEIIKGRRRSELFKPNVATEQDVGRWIKESTAWDVYNNEAGKVDNELVKDWRESLNTLLLFAAIFAAVLTAFIIESKKKLEQDPADVLVILTNFSINNNGNASNLPFIIPEFTPASTDIIVNCLLFSSLCAALATALATVIAIQWVADYDAAITRGGSSPEDRAKRRQFRFGGIKQWKMEEIIAALPLLLHASVALFAAAAIQWIWSINYQVGYVVIGGTAIAFIFYASTTLLASISTSVPFRTPLSRVVYWTWQKAIQNVILLGISAIFIGIPMTTGYLTSGDITIIAISIIILTTWMVVRSYESLRGWSEVNLVQKRVPSWLMWFGGCSSIMGAVFDLTILDGDIFVAVVAVLFWPGFRAPFFPVFRFIEAKLRAGLRLPETVKFRERIRRLKEQLKSRHWPLWVIWMMCIVVDCGLWSVINLWSILLAIPIIIILPGFIHRPFPIITSLKRTGVRAKGHVVRLLNKRIRPREREKQAPDLRPFLRQRALSWLARHLPTSIDASPRLLLLIAGVVDLSHETTFPDDFFQAPWRAILDVLGRCYMQTVLYKTPKDDDYEAIRILLQCSRIPRIQSRISPTNYGETNPSNTDYETDPSNPTYWSQCCFDRESFRKGISPANMTFLLARDVPIPTAGSINELKATVQLIRWRNSTGPKDISPWKMIFGDAKCYSPEYLKSCVESFVEVVRVSTTHQNVITSFASLLVNVQGEDEKYVQVIEVLEAFDMCMSINTDSDFHCNLVRIICRDLGQTRDQWPRSSTYPRYLVERVTGIKDPYLAIIGGYTCGIPISVKAGISEAYLGKYSESLSIVQSMLYEDVEITDPMAWQLRATFTSTDTSVSVQRILNEALKDLEQLLLLQIIFELPASCHGGILGSHHVLLHLYTASPDCVCWNQTRRVLGSIELMGTNINPIIALLGLSDTQSLSGLTLGGQLNGKLIERVLEISNELKKEPLSFILCLADIVHQASQAPCVPKVVALILDLAVEARIMPENDATTFSLRLLAYSLQHLHAKMIRDELESAEDAEVVDMEIARICELFLFTGGATLPHRQMTCARGSKLEPPARGYLAMYVE